MDETEVSETSSEQLRLFAWAEIDTFMFVDWLEDWPLDQVRALALDPDVELREFAALSNWNWDIRLQRVLATDPEESVVLHLLRRVDPPLEILEAIFAGPHDTARRQLAGRNLPSEFLIGLLTDRDEQVRCSASATLYRRGVVPPLEASAL